MVELICPLNDRAARRMCLRLAYHAVLKRATDSRLLFRIDATLSHMMSIDEDCCMADRSKQGPFIHTLPFT